MNALIDFFKNNPALATVLCGFAIFLMILASVLFVLRKKANDALKNQTKPDLTPQNEEKNESID